MDKLLAKPDLSNTSLLFILTPLHLVVSKFSQSVKKLKEEIPLSETIKVGCDCGIKIPSAFEKDQFSGEITQVQCEHSNHLIYSWGQSKSAPVWSFRLSELWHSKVSWWSCWPLTKQEAATSQTEVAIVLNDELCELQWPSATEQADQTSWTVWDSPELWAVVQNPKSSLVCQKTWSS